MFTFSRTRPSKSSSFFFSSRRRHTRCSRDWSSDVCSSDLGLRDSNGTVDRFFQADALFLTGLQAGTVMVVEFWRNATTVDWRSWALFNKSDNKAAVADLVGETVTFVSTKDADGRSVSFA